MIGLMAQDTAGLPSGVVAMHLETASSRIDSYLRSKHTLPLATPYPHAIVDACCVLAAYSLMTVRGFNAAEYDQNFRDRYEDLVGRPGQKGWLELLASGAASLSSTADATPTEDEGGPEVHTDTSRGWNRESDGDYETI